MRASQHACTLRCMHMHATCMCVCTLRRCASFRHARECGTVRTCHCNTPLSSHAALPPTCCSKACVDRRSFVMTAMHFGVRTHLPTTLHHACCMYVTHARTHGIRTRSDLFGPIPTLWDAFGCIRKHFQAFGRFRKKL